MQNKLGLVLVLAGALLIGGALALYGANRAEDEKAGAAAVQTAAVLQQEIEKAQTQHMETAVLEQPEDVSPEPSMDAPAEDAETQPAPVAMVGSYEYLGVLSLPSLGLELPVMDDWDYERLKLAPCRQFGSAETDDLVIAGHNYIGHFANLGMLKAGDSVTFTTMDGAVNTYVVAKTDIIDPEDTEKVSESGYALTLYTCTYGRQSRVTVYCERT